MQNNERSKMLGSMPMKKLVPKVSLPIMLSMLVQAMYNVVDSIFVSRYDLNALTAVSLAYPFQMLMIALSVGIGVGINSLISRKLGQRRADEARSAAWNGLFLEVGGSLLFALVGLLLPTTLMHTVVADTLNHAEAIREMGTQYLSIVCTFSLGLFMSVHVERMLQATGSTLFSMLTQMTGAVINIILDPILIFGLLGFPRLGVAGAAIATVIGQWCGMLLGLFLNQTRNLELKLRFSDARIDRTLMAGILVVGLPSAIMQAIGSVMNLGLNALLSTFPVEGNAAVNVLNVYFKLQSFVFMPVFGLGSGMVAIVGYNYGARLRDRVYESIKVALIWAVSIMAVGTLIFHLFPGALMSIFESEDNAALASQMTALGVPAMRIISTHFVIAAVCITLSNVFQALGKGMYSLIMSLCRQLVVLLPVAWLLARVTGSITAIWWCFPIAELTSLCLCLALYRKCDREMLSQLK